MFSTNQRTAMARWLGVVLTVAVVLVCALPLQAQVTVGDNLNLHLDGEFGFSYGGSFGSAGSGHGTGFIGNGNLNGWYYDPSFVNFEIRPFYNRFQESSMAGFIHDDEGVSASTNIFSGSRFPGSVSYIRSFGSGSTYGFANAGLLSSSSSARAFVVNWNVLMPNWPTLQVNYTDSGSSSSLFGTSADVTSNSKDLSFHSNYRWAGFDIMGTVGFTHQNSATPEFLETAGSTTESSGSYYSVQASHKIPMSGSASLGYYHSASEFDGENSGINTFSGGAGISPTNRLTFNGNIRYTSNLLGQLRRDTFVSALPTTRRSWDSSSFSTDASANYRIFSGLSANAFVANVQQSFAGDEESRTLYGAGATYMNSIPFLGYFRFGMTLVDYYNNYQKNNGLGAFNLDGSIAHKFGKWDTSADFTYSQNVATAVSWATASSYSYGATFQRKFTPTTMWYGSYRGSRSALTLVEGSDNHSETVSTGWAMGPYGVSGTYSRSGGTSVLTTNGTLAPSSPLTSVLFNNYILYNSNAIGVSGSAVLFRRVGLTGGYSKVNGETTALVNSLTEASSYYFRLRYKVRKLVINGYYRRIEQSITATGQRPREANAFSIEITRWFNVF